MDCNASTTHNYMSNTEIIFTYRVNLTFSKNAIRLKSFCAVKWLQDQYVSG